MACQIHIKPIYWFVLALLLVLGVWGYFMWASYGHLPSTVEKLKNEVELLKAPSDSIKLTKAIDLQKLELKIDRVETSIRNEFVLIQKLGIPLTVIGFALMFWSIYKSALGFALERAKETVDRYYLPDEERFKREKKLLVLTKEGGDSGFMRQLLQDTGFLAAATIPDNVKELDEETLFKILDGNKYDLILLNNEKSPFTNKEIQVCHDQTAGYTTIFSFGNPAPDEELKQDEQDRKQEKRESKHGQLSKELVTSSRVSSANFKSQLYGNLINALKYQKYLSKPSNTKQA